MKQENKLVIATRKSQLALWQAEHIKSLLEIHHPEIQVHLLPMSTQGDKILDAPLAKIGGKGLFVKALETAMLEGKADLAVHSMKDVPMQLPAGLSLPVICEREDPSDAWVSHQYPDFKQLPKGARVGTSSMRRQCQLLRIRPDLEVLNLRGNVNTRLAKLDEGQYDGIILATAGLIRLGFSDRISQRFTFDDLLPAVGQGAVGIECRSDDERLLSLMSPLIHHASQLRVTAERL